jgi:hypothetical protein
MTADFSPQRSLPTKSLFFASECPGRMVFSVGLLSMRYFLLKVNAGVV